MITQEEAEKSYLHHTAMIEEKLKSFGDNPLLINAFITNSYNSLYQENPTFIWFSLGTIVSESVGRNLFFSTETQIRTVGQAESANIITESFSKGNQVIYKDIVSLFLTYKSIGLDGMLLLKDSKIKNPIHDEKIQNTFIMYSKLEENQVAIAMAEGLEKNDSKVLSTLFSNQENINMASDIAINIAVEEQTVVQIMYKDELVKVLLDPTLGWVGGQLKLDEISILDKSFRFFDYVNSPPDTQQRIEFAKTLIKEVKNIIELDDLGKLNTQVKQKADDSLWRANPNNSSDRIGEVNGAFWGKKADEFDVAFKQDVKDFLGVKGPEMQNTAIASPVSLEEVDIFKSVFSGEHEIVKFTVDPLQHFLAMNPTYEVIAYEPNDIINAHIYFQQEAYLVTRYWNPQFDYLKNGTYIALKHNGDSMYYQPQGEVRGITYPFMYDKSTGVPLTKPIVDVYGNYDHTPTLEALYTNPEIFNTPGHPNWYNPNWYKQVQEAQNQAYYNYFKSIAHDSFMNAVTAPFAKVNYNYGQVMMELNGSDIIHNGSGTLDFSGLKGGNQAGSFVQLPDLNSKTNNSFSDSGHSIFISSIELKNGYTLSRNSESESFKCTNCNAHDLKILEDAVNSMAHHVTL